MTDLCIQCVDLDGDKYSNLADECERSFRDVTWNDVGAPNRVKIFRDGDRSNMMLQRVMALKDYLRKAEGNVILADCDMKWIKDPRQLFDEEYDIGLCWRTGNAAMPYYGGFVMVRHGSEAAINFVTEWWFTIATMPQPLQGWWGDQLALASIVGRAEPHNVVRAHGAQVKIFDAGRVFFNMQSKDQTPPGGVYAIHYKGDKKELAHAA